MGWPEIFEAKKANVKAWHGDHRDEKPKGSRHKKPSQHGKPFKPLIVLKTAEALDAPDQAPVAGTKKAAPLCGLP